jgi:2-(1,2-epoxy-1,2-dihydrophenyl)acetyl-CoA isomerase
VDLDKHLRWEIFNITKALSSLDGQEARRAFFEKRDPEFTGRGK